jgi:predicted esterase
MGARRSLTRAARAFRRPAALVLALAGMAAAPPAGPPASVRPPAAAPAAPIALPRGTVVEKVVAASDPAQSYALYLPSGYDPTRRWPIVYLFDARRRALVPTARFRAAAETYGYILASSYNSASDGPFEPNLKAMQAMWADTHRRFAIDDKRVYAAGFSGTVRSSCTLALAVPGSIAGVIGAGAGFPEGQPPTAKTPFVFFGTVGNRDFNYDEVTELDETLGDFRLAHRVEEFAGPHQWMPEDLATLAIQWMEVQAMRSGTRPRDPALLAALWSEDLGKARALEAAGDRLNAWHRYRAIAEEFAGLVDVSAAAAKAAELDADRDVRARRRQRRDLRDRDREIVQGWQRTLAAADPAAGPVNMPRLFADLRIAELKGRAAKDPESEPALAARRLLSTLAAQTSFYLPQLYLERKDYRRVEILYAVAAEVEPRRPDVWYNLAATRSRNGEGKRALEDLKRAIALGFKDAETLAGDEDFAALRNDPAFRDVLAGLRRQGAPASG